MEYHRILVAKREPLAAALCPGTPLTTRARPNPRSQLAYDMQSGTGEYAPVQ